MLLLENCKESETTVVLQTKHPLAPKQVEMWIIQNTGYNHPLLSCKQRAMIAEQYLRMYGYKPEVRISLCSNLQHAYVRYTDYKDGNTVKEILNNSNCYDIGPDYESK